METVPLSHYHTIKNFHETSQKLRSFFLERGFLEVDVQSRRSILAACEDPATIATYIFQGIKWPQPQTGQMWLEHDLLKNPKLPGLFCHTTSYRDEPNPIAERHINMFPLFEFETHGNMTTLQTLLEDLCEYLDLGKREEFRDGDYQAIANHYETEEIRAKQEMLIWNDFSPVFLLKNFPFYTHPFFNMKKEGGHAKKIDAILYGMEVMGTAERSCNVDEMYEFFHTISHGMFAKLLFNHFGKERVTKELDEFLSHDFFTRCGGGIGMTRLMRAIQLSKQERGELPLTTAKQPTGQLQT